MGLATAGHSLRMSVPGLGGASGTGAGDSLVMPGGGGVSTGDPGSGGVGSLRTGDPGSGGDGSLGMAGPGALEGTREGTTQWNTSAATLLAAFQC